MILFLTLDIAIFTAKLLATNLLGKHAMRKASGNWVVGEKFFGYEAELDALTECVREGTNSGPTPLDYRLPLEHLEQLKNTQVAA